MKLEYSWEVVVEADWKSSGCGARMEIQMVRNMNYVYSPGDAYVSELNICYSQLAKRILVIWLSLSSLKSHFCEYSLGLEICFTDAIRFKRTVIATNRFLERMTL